LLRPACVTLIVDEKEGDVVQKKKL